jgi:pachytene checkpoint protein 2
VLSRADLVMTTVLPDETTIEEILHGSLRELAAQWPALRPLADDRSLRAKLAACCLGLDGRRVRKVVLSALAMRHEVALEPGQLTAEDLLDAAAWMSEAAP